MPNTSDNLLDCMFELKTRIYHFFSPDYESIFNTAHHGLSETEVKTSLLGLFGSGYIEFTDTSGHRPIRQVSAITEMDDNWLVSLTNKGGEHWEAIHLPDWSKYLSVSTWFPDEQAGETITIEGGSKEIVDYLIQSLQTKSGQIFEQSKIEKVSPWNATYWKILEVGYTAQIENAGTLSETIAAITSQIHWKQ